MKGSGRGDREGKKVRCESRSGKLPADEFVTRLNDALSWAGVQRGWTFSALGTALGVFEAGRGSGRDVLVLDEAGYMVEVYELWRDRHTVFPGLLDSIRRCFSKGLVIPDEEQRGKPHSRARNDLFVFYLGGILCEAQLDLVVVDGISHQGSEIRTKADLVLGWQSDVVSIECKRPYDQNTLTANVVKAGSQIRGGKIREGTGIIALDCSRLVRSPGYHLRPLSDEHALELLAERLHTDVMPTVARAAPPEVLGAVVLARAPAVISTGRSGILGPSGALLRRELPSSVRHWVTWRRPEVPGADVVDAIADALRRHEPPR